MRQTTSTKKIMRCVKDRNSARTGMVRYSHQFDEVVLFWIILHSIWFIIKNIGARTTPFHGAILEQIE